MQGGLLKLGMCTKSVHIALFQSSKTRTNSNHRIRTSFKLIWISLEAFLDKARGTYILRFFVRDTRVPDGTGSVIVA